MKIKIVIVNGQNHKGSTRMVARQLAEKVGGEITEFFLPKDFDEPCLGCLKCFKTDMSKCPHYEKFHVMTEAMDEADLIILASPVYVFHATGQMMNFLDHYGTKWMVHHPNPKMFHKQAVCISTAAGGGIKSTNKDMYDSLVFWGIAKIYKLGCAVMSTSPTEIPESIRKKIDHQTDVLTNKIIRNKKVQGPTLQGKLWFYIIRFAHKHGAKLEPDDSCWEERGELGAESKSPFGLLSGRDTTATSISNLPVTLPHFIYQKRSCPRQLLLSYQFYS